MRDRILEGKREENFSQPRLEELRQKERDKNISDEAEAVPSLETKIGVETNRTSVRSSLLNGQSIQFILTDGFDLYLGDLGHDETRFKNGLKWSDITVRGGARMKNNKIEIWYYNKPTEGLDGAIRKTLDDFLID